MTMMATLTGSDCSETMTKGIAGVLQTANTNEMRWWVHSRTSFYISGKNSGLKSFATLL